MSTHGNEHHGPHHGNDEHKPTPGWKRVHHSWIFWVGVVLTLAALLVYVMSMDLAWRPRVHAQRPQASAAGR